ncbi:MAG: SgcJ/EcaC family oxidoreductase [Candidatus Glassbacteria bacterium]
MSDIRARIEAADREFEKAFNRGDAAGVTALYTKDAKLLPPNMEMMQGREAVRAFWQGAMDMGCKTASLEIEEVEKKGDIVVEIGKYTLVIKPAGGQTITDRGKYVVLWKQENGAWKLDTDIWNSSLPASH